MDREQLAHEARTALALVQGNLDIVLDEKVSDADREQALWRLTNALSRVVQVGADLRRALLKAKLEAGRK